MGEGLGGRGPDSLNSLSLSSRGPAHSRSSAPPTSPPPGQLDCRGRCLVQNQNQDTIVELMSKAKNINYVRRKDDISSSKNFFNNGSVEGLADGQ